jgi:hypothetical protein
MHHARWRQPWDRVHKGPCLLGLRSQDGGPRRVPPRPHGRQRSAAGARAA